MIKGVLNIYRNKMYITSASKRFKVSPGQYIYLIVHGSRVPVIASYSQRRGSWYFRNLEGLEVEGLTAEI